MSVPVICNCEGLAHAPGCYYFFAQQATAGLVGAKQREEIRFTEAQERVAGDAIARELGLGSAQFVPLKSPPRTPEIRRAAEAAGRAQLAEADRVAFIAGWLAHAEAANG